MRKEALFYEKRGAFLKGCEDIVRTLPIIFTFCCRRSNRLSL